MNHELVGSRTCPVNQSVLGYPLSLEGTSEPLTSGSCVPPPSHVPRAWERNEEHVHALRQSCDFRRQQFCASIKPQETKIRILWAPVFSLRADQHVSCVWFVCPKP